MSQSQPAMTLKLLSLRREGEYLAEGMSEISVHMSVTGGQIPLTGTLTVQIPDAEVSSYLQNGVNQLSLRAVSSIHEVYDRLQRAGNIPALE
ncbi:hypothetical protein [Acetobacter pasteurianus]|uniref:hypothetical protein n=1 Tax=Acetobacter pasteurianus TaxID=438 RepID=UPI0012FB9EF6|nr:hypothetical protein [Acetobacter pasteurianus]